MVTYFVFAAADDVFSDDDNRYNILREEISVREVRELMGGAVPCVNKSHEATIDAMEKRFGIRVRMPEGEPRVLLESGDRLIVAEVRNLPRLAGRRECTNREIMRATFTFSLYTVWCRYPGTNLDLTLTLGLST